MNNRIQELAEQAGLQSFYVEYSPWQVEFEKFAELIVRECLNVCKEQSRYDPIVLPYKPSEQFSNAIKEHFGVEE